LRLPLFIGFERHACAAIAAFATGGYASHIKASALLPLGRKTPSAIYLEHQLNVEVNEVLLPELVEW